MVDDSEEFRRNLQKRVKQDSVRLDTDGELWEKVLNEIEASEKRSRKIPFYWYASAASLFIILTTGLTYIYLKSNNKDNAKVIAYKIQKKETASNLVTDTIKSKKISDKTEPGKTQTEEKIQSKEKTITQESFQTSDKIEPYRMADGSEITLNASGDIQIKTFHNKNIEIDLSGEGYFDVVPGLKRSFKVNFGQSSLEVIGTEFSIRNFPEESVQEVLVSEGIVKVTLINKQEITLKKGAFLQIDKKTGKSEVRDVNPSHYLSWKTKRLIFAETPLPEVAAVLSRVHRTKIEVENNIKSCTFTGDLSQMTLEDALKVIEVTTSTEVNSNTNHVIKISGVECY